MKAEDLSILIGANGDTDAWWSQVLPVAAAQIDFLFTRQSVLADRWCYHGKDANNRNPSWEKGDAIVVKDARLLLDLEPVSVTVLSLPLQLRSLSEK